MLLFGLWLTLATSGCSILSPLTGQATSDDREWLMDGTLAISRPLPPIKLSSGDRSRLGSIAQIHSSSSPYTIVRINRSAGKLSLESPDSTPITVNAQVASTLRPGSYTVALKQANPLWYAPNTYFKQRSMRVPAEGSKERFKRGALGKQALFLNEQTPLHSGPVGTLELGGLRIAPQDMNRIFELVRVGTKVEVR